MLLIFRHSITNTILLLFAKAPFLYTSEYLLFLKKSDNVHSSEFMDIEDLDIENAIKNIVESSHKNLQ